MIKKFFKKRKKEASLAQYILISASVSFLVAVAFYITCLFVFFSMLSNVYRDYDRKACDKTDSYVLSLIKKAHENNYASEDITAENGFFSTSFARVFFVSPDQSVRYLEERGSQKVKYEGVFTFEGEEDMLPYPVALSDGAGCFVSYSIHEVDSIFYIAGLAVPLICSLFVLGFILYLRIRHLFYEFDLLAKGISNFEKGDLEYKIEKGRIKEFCVLSDLMNTMARSLDLLAREKEYAEKEQKRMLSNISHDLRTPVTVIIGYLELLTHADSESRYSKNDFNVFLQACLSKSIRLKNLLEDFFTYTKLVGSDVKVSSERIDLGVFFEQYVAEVDHVIECNSVSFPLYVSVDVLQLERIFDNIYKNCIDHGVVGGKIIFSLKYDEKNNKAIMNFSNEIFSFIKIDCNHIFDRTYTESFSRKESGSGLGLAIVKEAVSMIGGRVSASCEKSFFTLTLELKAE